MKHLIKILTVSIAVVWFAVEGRCQSGGMGIYKFMDIPPSARLSALNTNFLSTNDNDVNVAFVNPSVLNKELNGFLALNYVNFFSNIKLSNFVYAQKIKNIGMFDFGITYLNYGNFKYADPTGLVIGDFKAADYMINVGWGRQLDSVFSIGANLKNIYSVLETYKSYGIAFDVAGNYFNRKSNFSVSIIGRNIGKQITTYYEGNKEPIEYDIQLALSKRLRYVPLMFHVILNRLNKYDLTYETAEDIALKTDPLTKDTIVENVYTETADKLMRHVVVGGEFFVGKHLSIQLAYNYLRRQEMKILTKKGLTGFSFGFGIKIQKFSFNYSRSNYHQAGSPNYFTIALDVNSLKKIKKNKSKQ